LFLSSDAEDEKFKSRLEKVYNLLCFAFTHQSIVNENCYCSIFYCTMRENCTNGRINATRSCYDYFFISYYFSYLLNLLLYKIFRLKHFLLFYMTFGYLAFMTNLNETKQFTR